MSGLYAAQLLGETATLTAFRESAADAAFWGARRAMDSWIAARVSWAESGAVVIIRVWPEANERDCSWWRVSLPPAVLTMHQIDAPDLGTAIVQEA